MQKSFLICLSLLIDGSAKRFFVAFFCGKHLLRSKESGQLDLSWPLFFMRQNWD